MRLCLSLHFICVYWLYMLKACSCPFSMDNCITAFTCTSETQNQQSQRSMFMSRFLYPNEEARKKIGDCSFQLWKWKCSFQLWKCWSFLYYISININVIQHSYQIYELTHVAQYGNGIIYDPLIRLEQHVYFVQ